ncbi:MAG TPA: amidohydrolase family protein [Actinophytocola sp.]|uniref:amidohydrolase family protein n=1 Tax=Actinophytocola sp. TaxID=1872138 RepID=UPI002DB95196|nr:amidohydrolase family protein [Actinophytocola sp.]HEU5471439.1 amidohydrolase family protein [Actinophytocola sp.]
MLTDGLPLIDQHCHGVVTEDLDDATVAGWLTEAPALPAHRDPFDSLLGKAVLRWCAPVLDLPPHPGRTAYLRRRAELGWREVTGRLLRAAGVSDWLVDTGFVPDPPLSGPAGSGPGAGHEVVRIEHVAETAVARGAETLDVIAAALRERASGAVALKTIAGYRCGLDLPAAPPPDAEAGAALGRWLRSGQDRLTDPVLLAWLVHEATRLGLPLQVHTGFGDPDLRLRAVDPALLHPFLESTVDSGITVVLLHCWPYHRNAGYLAHVFPHVLVDVGLTVPFTGARFGAVLAEVLELAPFDAVVYSSDGRVLPELHHLAAALWRRHTGRLLDEWIAEDVLSTVDAERLAGAIGSGNAARVYGLRPEDLYPG